MKTLTTRATTPSLVTLVAGVLLAACADRSPLEPSASAGGAALAAHAAPHDDALAAMRRATARYHNLDAALADGFVFFHGCETRPDEGPAGALYVHFARLFDGVIDPAAPDALLYEPRANGSPRLVGVELAVPYAMWPASAPPQFGGASFQGEDEFGVWGLHVWLWRDNPEGLFAESNPRVDCGDA